MTDEIKPAFKDEAQLLGWGDSDRSGAWLKLRVLPEDLENFRGKQGTVYAVVMVEIDGMSGKPETKKSTKQAPNGSQMVAKQSEKTPYGALIAKLHTGGLFMCPAVWMVLGGSKSYEKWSQLQPCIVCGDMDYVEVTPGEGLVGRCEFSHIKTAANSGTGIKPEFSGNPMCNKHHSLQHNSGEIAVYQEYVMRTVGAIDDGEDIKIAAMSWLEKQNAENIVKWAHAKLGVVLKVEKLSECHPKYIYAWAAKNKLLKYLPAAFRTDEILNNAKNM